ncbi:hypothetical protein C3747_17g605 [Trypanosoma cruzi]|uniref:Membrane-bound acid phosphatase 2 n=2 Tax=Trypanosoma cruzi TaxID=5693 RepID=Q4DNS0_TRYCC|nr:hypothetical protein Tc00.1047053511589.74 [Trypanosoma cruzi]EAN94177.1 hypothetical protein Tc00.1047053511589.74 [Trypanosoma cruzi]PWV17616.1 hypothetical protein C3747_17g605 [Trypanosoma cruzi]|eukprot:XP_816028.1 hypothetical protein [Trypanosoma cruzi strain CL Brener]
MGSEKMQMRLMMLLLLLVVGLPYAVSGQGLTLQRVAILARNGARGLSSLRDGKISCDACELSPVGEEMSFRLGEFLLSRYGNLLNLGNHLNTTVVSFRAEETSRTIAMGQGVTLGMFPRALPLVKYTPQRNDEVLAFTKSWPSWILQEVWKSSSHLDNAWLSEKLNEEDIKTISRFLPPDNEGLCKSLPSLCALYVYDSWCVNASEGRTDATLQPLLAALGAVSRRLLWRLYGADPGDSIKKHMGPLAGPFLREVMSSFSSNDNKARLAFYVGSMPVVFAALSGLGVFDAKNTLTVGGTPLPQFGDAIAFEYKTTGTQQYVQVYQITWTSGGPGSRGYTGKPLDVKCMDAEGNTYMSSTAVNGCPMGDMQRYFSSLGAADGQCFVTDSALADASCDGDAAPPVDSLCYMYRSKCPGLQCGSVPDAIADPSRGFSCQDPRMKENASYLSAFTVAVWAPSLLTGATLGLYLSDRIRPWLCLKRRSAEL